MLQSLAVSDKARNPMLPPSQHNLTTTPCRIRRRRSTGSSREEQHHHRHHHQQQQQQQHQGSAITRRNSSRMIMTFTTTSYLMLSLLLITTLAAPKSCSSASAFVIPPPTGTPPHRSLQLHHQALQVMTDREADFVEQMVGGERYSMIPLPDSMTDTTLFVGNLCEFVSDDDLSRLFQTVSVLHSLPACVARKPNTQSLEYGFVAFPTVQEKEAAIIRFNGFCYKGRSLRVQPIIDHPKQGRVRVPERLVAYVSGDKKGLRRCCYVARRGDTMNNNKISMKRPTQNGSSARSSSSRSTRPSKSLKQPLQMHHHHHQQQQRRENKRTIKLSDQEQAELDRAVRKGFLTLTAGRRQYSIDSQKGGSPYPYSLVSPLAKKHRQWCDARGKPQIVLLKAVRGGGGGANDVLDQVCIDLSPLRLPALFDDPHQAADILQKWKTEIVVAASNAGMEFLESSKSSSSSSLSSLSPLDKEDKDDSWPTDERNNINSSNKNKNHWATDPIGKLPVLSLGTFLGERSKAKEMTKVLAKLWDIPEQQQQQQREDDTTSHPVNSSRERRPRYKNRRQQQHNSKHIMPISSGTSVAASAAGGVGVKGNKRPKITKGLSEHRKRGGGHRQSWY